MCLTSAIAVVSLGEGLANPAAAVDPVDTTFADAIQYLQDTSRPTADGNPARDVYTDDELYLALEEVGAEDIVITPGQVQTPSGGYTNAPGGWEPGEVITPDAGSGTAARGSNLPTNIFDVSSSWASWVKDRKAYVAFYGRWNYRDDFIGAGNPYDAAGIVVSGFNINCWTNVSTGLKTQSSDGTFTNRRALMESTHQSSIWNVDDRASGFRLLTDMGFAWVEMRKNGTGGSCDARKSGRFYHEHNQNGGGSFTAGINFHLLTLEYSQSFDQKLQKGTPIKYFS